MENLNAAGTVSSSTAIVGLAADTGLRAYEERTEARKVDPQLRARREPVSYALRHTQ